MIEARENIARRRAATLDGRVREVAGDDAGRITYNGTWEVDVPASVFYGAGPTPDPDPEPRRTPIRSPTRSLIPARPGAVPDPTRCCPFPARREVTATTRRSF
ncbi:MAG: hypothetical protein R3D25_02000 [Geminicoccaceae bacterium]